MSELGRLLNEARTAKGLTLADVESTTRIRQKYLQALENGEWAKLPRGTTARGFLRAYATFLELDLQQALDLYASESGDVGQDVAIAEPGKPRLVDYRPLEVELSDTAPRATWVPWVIAVIVVAGLGAGAWWLLNNNPGWNLLSAFRRVPTPTMTPTSTPTRWVVTASPEPTATPVLATATSDILPLPTPTVLASPTPTPRPTSTPEVVARIALELRTSQSSWIRVVIDGQLVEEVLLEPNVTRSWEAQSSITLRTGNAGGVVLMLNGEDLGPMGEIGQVVERSWIVDQGEVTETIPDTPTPEPVPTLAPTQEPPPVEQPTQEPPPTEPPPGPTVEPPPGG